jgi:hypothetical protein
MNSATVNRSPNKTRIEIFTGLGWKNGFLPGALGLEKSDGSMMTFSDSAIT